jgi:LmbE family N-acetylglucosaminyl deacetylase
MTSGEISAPPSERELEALQASEIIGAELILLHEKDGLVNVDKHSIGKLMRTVNQIKPDIAYIPHPHDTHQDHVATAHIGLASCRAVDKVLHYELPHTGNLFHPDTYINITDVVEDKKHALGCHRSQRTKQCLDVDSVTRMANNYGYKLGYPQRYFEAFETVRWISW